MLLWDLKGDLRVSPVLSLVTAHGMGQWFTVDLRVCQGNLPALLWVCGAADEAIPALQVLDFTVLVLDITVWVLGTLLQPCWQLLEVPTWVPKHPGVAGTLLWRRKHPVVLVP